MPTIQELNQRRAETALVLQNLGMANQPTDYDKRLKLDAQYRLALDANMRAEQDYRAALAALSSEDLIALSCSVPGDNAPAQNKILAGTGKQS